MATNFPASLDSLTNPTSSDSLNSPSHSAQHANSNDAIEALQAKVGADSSAVTSSLDYKVAQLESDVSGLVTGKILQVVNATHSTQVLVSSTTYAATGVAATITPTAATSKVFVIITNPMRAWNENNGQTDSGHGLSKLYRDGSEIHAFWQFGYNDNELHPRDMRWNGTLTFVDSPATTSATTYEQYIASDSTSRSTYSCVGNNTASITLMEVGA